MYTIFADAVITRRKRFHLIADETGEIVWRARLWGEIARWLAERDQTEYMVASEQGNYHIVTRTGPAQLE